MIALDGNGMILLQIVVVASSFDFIIKILKHTHYKAPSLVYMAQFARKRANKETRKIVEIAKDLMALDPLQPSVLHVKMQERYSRWSPTFCTKSQ